MFSVFFLGESENFLEINHLRFDDHSYSLVDY